MDPITAFMAAKTFLGKVPREVWYALAALAAWWWFSSHYIEQGRQEVLSELREKAAEAEKKAQAAKKKADENATERAETFEAQQEVLNDAIEEAEKTGGNALDGLFTGLSG